MPTLINQIHWKLIPTSPPSPANPNPHIRIAVRCGPRSNRTPLSKGRTLSTEAILAVQSLKRAHASKSPFPSLARLLKPDLVACLKELLRQDLCPLALHVLSTLRTEFPSHDPGDELVNLYSDVIFALYRNGYREEIDRLVLDLEECSPRWGSAGVPDKGLVRIVRGLVEAGRRESTLRVVAMMKRSGCGETWTADSYLIRTLVRGLNAMGEADLAAHVEEEFGRVLTAGSAKSAV